MKMRRSVWVSLLLLGLTAGVYVGRDTIYSMIVYEAPQPTMEYLVGGGAVARYYRAKRFDSLPGPKMRLVSPVCSNCMHADPESHARCSGSIHLDVGLLPCECPDTTHRRSLEE